MKVKKTLHEVYAELKELREVRDMRARLVAESFAEGDQEAADGFNKKFKYVDEVINYLSEIEVEYEDKYETEEDDD